MSACIADVASPTPAVLPSQVLITERLRRWKGDTMGAAVARGEPCQIQCLGLGRSTCLGRNAEAFVMLVYRYCSIR
jgi:hypothetical protein